MDRFIDSHNHLHAFGHDVWELLAIAGMAGTVLSCGNPHVYREIWHEVPSAGDVRGLWESPLRFAEAAEEKHFVRVGCALGISSMTRVDAWEQLIEALPDYLADPRVVALGEVGLDPGQYFGHGWSLEEQAECLEAQARIAAQLGLPLILHTPTPKNTKDFLGGVQTQGDVAPEEFRLHYLKRDLEIIDRAGLDPSLLVVDHVDGTIVDYVHEETSAWCATSLGSTLRVIPPATVVEWVKRHGAGRILLNSDLVPYTSNETLCIPKAARALRRANVPEEDIRRVCFENANHVFRLGL